MIQNLPKSLQSDYFICIPLKFLLYLKTPPGHIVFYPDRKSIYFFNSKIINHQIHTCCIAKLAITEVLVIFEIL